jgi:drug/metabolite transporter (DMT)-like permease
MDSVPHIGEVFALLSPMAWAVAVILFRVAGRSVPPLALNLTKNCVAWPLFALTYYALGASAPDTVTRTDLILLIVSGVLGIAVADTLFFMCLNRLGASRQAIVNTAYSPPIILLSVLFLGERLSVMQVLGVCLILMAVVTVGRENSGASDDVRGRRLSGVLLGVGACLAQAISVVMIKPRMGEWPVLWMTCWRMAGGVVAMLLLWPLFPKTQRSLAALADRRCWPTVLAGTLVGTYLSLLLWMGGFKYTQASVAAALNQTATLFTFILAVWILREPVTRRALMGLALGLLGVIIMGVASI